MLLSAELWIDFTVTKILVFSMTVCENYGFTVIVIVQRTSLVSTVINR